MDEPVLPWKHQSSATSATISQVLVSILHFFQIFDKLLDGIADHSQQPDILVHKISQNAFIKLCNQNNYDESI